MSDKNRRMYFLDWLRVGVVLLIIPHHVAVTFSHIGNGYVYTEEPVGSLYYFLQSGFLNLWFMRLLFFISGVSAYMSLQRRSRREYLNERVKKLLIPSLFVIFLIGPLSAYVAVFSQGTFAGSIISFYPEYVRNISHYLGWAHMWFCVYLFTFSLLTVNLFNFLKNSSEKVEKVNLFLSKGNNIFIPMFLIVIIEIVFRPFYPGYQNLINDWANFFLYLTLLVLGFIMGQSEKVICSVVNRIRVFAVLSILSSVFYIYLDYLRYYSSFFISLYRNNEYFFNVCLAFLRGVAAYVWVMFFIGLGKKLFNRSSPLLVKLSRGSFGLYIFHYLIITIVNSYLIKTRINHYVIFIVSIVSTYLSFMLLHKFVIKKVKLLRFVCGLKE